MNLLMVGVDFTRADIALREPLSFVRGQVLALLPRIAEKPGVSGCALLATCNRTELYVHLTDGAEADALSLLCAAAGVPPESYRAAAQVLRGSAVARHLAEVAAGVQSQIYGDDQIVSQVRDAAALARQAGAMDAVMDTLFRRAVTAGKRVRTETRLRGVPPSAAQRAIERAETFFGGLAGKRAVVIGNGEMGRLSAALLRDAGCAVTITLRTYRHGETVVPAGCATHPYDDRAALLDGADLAVSATTSPHLTIAAEQVRAMKHPPRLLIDLAMPRDIDGAAAGGQTTVWNLDDLGRAADENAADRARAMEIVAEELAAFAAWHAYRRSLPVIDEVKETALRRLRFDHGFSALYEENDVDGLLELAVGKTVDLLLGGMKEAVSPERLTDCLARMRKGMNG